MLSRLTFLLVAGLFSINATSQVFTREFRTSSPWFYNNEDFASHVELSYPYLFVSHPENDAIVNGALVDKVGAIAIYKQDSSGQWQLFQELGPDTSTVDLFFGQNVTVYGNRMVCTSGELNTSVGSVYSFVKTTSGLWTLDEVLNSPTSLDSSNYIASAALTDSALAVGSLSSNGGAVWVYKLNSSGQWGFSQRLTDTAEYSFGSSVSISKDWLAIGAKYKSQLRPSGGVYQWSGAAHFFKLDTNGQYVLHQDLIGIARELGFYGNDIDISGDKAVVAAHGTDTDYWFGPTQQGYVYCYRLDSNTGNWVRESILNENKGMYGKSVDLVGSRLVIGSPYHFRTNPHRLRAGKVFVYDYDTGVSQYAKVAEISTNSLDSNRFFGISVSADESRVLIGESGGPEWDSNYLKPGRLFLYNDSCQVNVWDTIRTCAGSYTWRDNVTYTQSADTLSYLHSSTVGCDTLYNLHLTVSSADTAIQIIVSCEPYTWIDGITYTTTTDTASYSYLNQAGCDSTVLLEFYLNAPDTSVSQVDSVLTSNDLFADYQWVDCSNGNTIIPGETNQTFTASSNGQYAVIVNRGSCYDTSACYIVEGIGENEYFSNGDIVLTPNPNNGSFSLQSSNSLGGCLVRIVDVQGKVCLEQQLESDTNYHFDTDLIPGVYTVLLIGDNRANQHFRLVVK
ncbi:MAG: T9SS type A sorting domain-containing protein [Flavobacteriia bacterium]|nr:T9SS type A sorting domain-containing protein [Flavobacteriia bacterium]